MTVSASANKPSTFAARLRKRRRRLVKEYGKRGIRGLSGFLGRQSLVDDRPVFDAAEFPFLRELELNWRKIRAELDQVLTAREHLPPFQMISRDQKKIARDDRWKTFILFDSSIRRRATAPVARRRPDCWRKSRTCRRPCSPSWLRATTFLPIAA